MNTLITLDAICTGFVVVSIVLFAIFTASLILGSDADDAETEPDNERPYYWTED